VADNDGGTGAMPSANDPGSGARPSGQQDPSASTGNAGDEGARPDSQADERTAALDKERELRREAEANARQYRRRIADLEDAGKSENDRLASQLKRTQDDADEHKRRVAELEGEIARRDLDQLKRDVAAEAGLPPSVASRLQGTDRRSLRADAEALSKELGDSQQGHLGIGRGSAASGKRSPVDMNTLIRRAAGRE
jgi:chromosome segregation ATPase